MCVWVQVLNCILIYIPGLRAFLLLQQDKQFRYEVSTASPGSSGREHMQSR